MWKKRISRIAIASILLTVLLFVLIQTAGFQQWLLRRIQNMASAANFPFKADKLRLNIFELQASLDGFIYDKDGTSVRVDHVTLDIPWNGYFGKAIIVNSLIVDGVTINIQSPEPIMPEPTEQKTSMPKFEIGRLAIHNVNLTYTNQSTLVRIPSFNIDATNGRGSVKIASPVTISPDTQIALQEIPIVLGTDGLQYGPMQWSAQYTDYEGRGSADGDVTWSPSVAFHLNFTTQPMTIDQWKNLEASGRAAYELGIMKFSDVRIIQEGQGQMIASAEISDQKKSASVIWNGLQLAPAGFEGVTDGSLELKWKASDLSDASGEGVVDIASRQYGKAHSNIKIENAKAKLDITANALDAAIRANIVAGLDRTLAGTFNITQRKYGLVNLQGKLSGTFDNPAGDASLTVRDATYEGVGPLNASAKASVRGRLVTVSNLRAQLKNSTIPDGSARIHLDSKAISGTIPQINVDLHDFVEDAQGKATLAATIDGTTDRPAANLTGSSDGIDVGGTHVDSVKLDGRFANDVFVLKQLEARQADGSLAATGSVNVITKRIDADAHIDNLQLTQVHELSATVDLDAKIQGTPISPAANFKGDLKNVVYQGREHGNVSVEGTTANKIVTIVARSDKYNATADAEVTMLPPYRFEATLTANDSHIKYDQYDVVADGKAHATGQAQPFEARNLNFDNFTVQGNGIDLTANGPMETGTRVHLIVDLTSVPVEAVTMTGEATVDGVISGPVTNPVIDGTLVTTNALVQFPQMTDPAAIQANVDFNRNDFVIREMHASMSDATAKIIGKGTLKGTGEIQFQAANIRPERFLKDRPLSGLLGVEGKFQMTAPNIESVSGSARVTQLDLKVRDIPIQQVQPIEVAIENQALTIRSFEIEGLNTHATIAGGANLRTLGLNFDIEGTTDLGILEAIVPESSAEGKVATRLAVRGTTAQPSLEGFITVADTTIETANPPVLLSGVDAEIRFTGNRMDIVRATGSLNEGEFKATGGSGISAEGLSGASIKLTLTKVQLEYPEGLQSELSTDITIAGSSPNLEAEGTIDINNALYRQDIDLNQQIFDRITAQAGETGLLAPPNKAPAIAEQIQLNIEVRTTGLVTVANNMANLDLTGNFRVRGNASNPIILGRAAVLDGGELYFGPGVATASSTPGERRDRYTIDRGEINFTNALRTEPNFDLEATHEMDVPGERYLITLRATGTPATLKTELTSEPPLAESDIALMLLTGRTYEQLQGSAMALGQEKLASYLSGQASGFFNTAGSALGLDTVTIEPVNGAETSDLGARLTLGKHITKNFNFTFSQNLAGSEDQTLIANYSWVKNLLFRGIRSQENKEIRFEVKHDLKIGGGPPLPKRIEPRSESILSNVTFSGTALSAKELGKRVSKPGKPFNVYRMRDDTHALQEFFAEKDLLNAKIKPQAKSHDGQTDVSFVIVEGPTITFGYEGAKVSKKVREDIKKIWVESFLESTSLQASTNRLLRELRDDGYLKAQVAYRNESENKEKLKYVFTMDPGPKFKDPEWLFKGIEPVEVPKDAGVVLEKPEAIQERIVYELQKKGYLDAKATVPELIYEEDRPRFVVTADPGAQYMVGKIDFKGNVFMKDQRLITAVRQGPTNPAPTDEAGRPPELEKELPLFPFSSDWIEQAHQRAITEYWQEGFNDVQINPSTTTDKATSQVAVHFDVTEGERQMIENLEIEGADITDMKYVMRHFQFNQGDPVDYTRINLTRKKLYDTRLFKRVDIDVVKKPSSDGYITQVRLNESAPWRIRYGLAVGNHSGTKDRDIGISTDFTYSNFLGKGIIAGVSVKGTASERDARIYGTMPTFFNRDVRTTMTTFRTRDLTFPEKTVDLWGYTVQQQWRLKNFYILSYDYSYRWDHTDDRDSTDDKIIENVTLPIARFNGTLSRDTRDDILNATRGTFLSNSFEVAPPGVGSAVRFIRNYTQYFRFKQIGRNMVWATAIRGGAARAFSGTQLVDTERFMAGGGSSLRAFQQDRLTLSPGNAIFIVNTEIRRPLFWKIGGVAFFDAGNVYETARNLNVFKLRYSPGIGLRLQTPLVLLRIDAGFNLWPRTGEQRQRFAWGIGQAF